MRRAEGGAWREQKESSIEWHSIGRSEKKKKKKLTLTSFFFSFPTTTQHFSAVSIAVILACLLFARSHVPLAKPSSPAAAKEATAATMTKGTQNTPPLPPPPPPPPPPLKLPVASSFFDLPPVPALLPAPDSNPEAATIDLARLRGRVVLAFNSASACGFTQSNLRGLSALAKKLGPQGLTVLGFPCNAFGGQEPGGPFEIAAELAKARGGPELASEYFLMASKVAAVAGPEAHPVFKFLTSSSEASSSSSSSSGSKEPTWNFFKYVIGRDGKVAASFGSEWREADVEAAVLEALQKKHL